MCLDFSPFCNQVLLNSLAGPQTISFYSAEFLPLLLFLFIFLPHPLLCSAFFFAFPVMTKDVVSCFLASWTSTKNSKTVSIYPLPGWNELESFLYLYMHDSYTSDECVSGVLHAGFSVLLFVFSIYG